MSIAAANDRLIACAICNSSTRPRVHDRRSRTTGRWIPW